MFKQNKLREKLIAADKWSCKHFLST